MKRIITSIILIVALTTPNFANNYITKIEYKTSDIVSKENSGMYAILINNTAQMFIGKVISMENKENDITDIIFLFEINELNTPINEITCNSFTLNTGDGFIRSITEQSLIQEFDGGK